MADHISLLTELQQFSNIVSYKHAAPTELKHPLCRIDV
jgi:hypothetical protein